MKINPVGAESTRTDGWADRRKDMTKKIIAFRKFAEVPKKPGGLGKLSVLIVRNVKDAEIKFLYKMQGFCITIY
jgi:hypothetical protein